MNSVEVTARPRICRRQDDLGAEHGPANLKMPKGEQVKPYHIYWMTNSRYGVDVR